MGRSTASTSGLEASGYLEGIVDPPLKTSEGTHHHYSGTESSPEASETDLAIDGGDCFTDGVVSFSVVDL